jgi:integrase
MVEPMDNSTRPGPAKVRGVYEHPKGSGVWWICYFENGRRHREKVGARQLAISAYAKRKIDIREHKFFPEQIRPVYLRFEELAADALEYCRQYHVTAGHGRDLRQMNTLLRWFKGHVATTITPQDIERKLAALSDAGRKPATLNRYRSMLSLIFSLGMRNGKVKANPAREVRRRTENNERVRHLDEEEEQALRAVIQARFPDREAELDLALQTGMRRGEQYQLRWQDANLASGIITIPRSKHGGVRHIPINSTARAVLEGLRSRTGSQLYVCPGPQQNRESTNSRWFEKAVRTAGVEDFRWHDLRHTFASRLAMAGVNLRAIQELLGHKSVAMTQRYTHLSDSHLRQAIEQITTPPMPASEQPKIAANVLQFRASGTRTK